MHTALVIGSSGFVVCRRLLDDGFRVIGLDCLDPKNAEPEGVAKFVEWYKYYYNT